MRKINKGEELASEIITVQASKIRFWFCAFIVAILAFIISCFR